MPMNYNIVFTLKLKIKSFIILYVHITINSHRDVNISCSYRNVIDSRNNFYIVIVSAFCIIILCIVFKWTTCNSIAIKGKIKIEYFCTTITFDNSKVSCCKVNSRITTIIINNFSFTVKVYNMGTTRENHFNVFIRLYRIISNCWNIDNLFLFSWVKNNSSINM